MEKKELLKKCKFYKGGGDPYSLFADIPYPARGQHIAAWKGEAMWVNDPFSLDDAVGLSDVFDFSSVDVPLDLAVCLFTAFRSPLDKGRVEPLSNSEIWHRFVADFVPFYISSMVTS